MRGRMGVLVMEEASGGVAVQLFEDPAPALASFREMRGKVGDRPSRATLVSLEFREDGSVGVAAETRGLPVLPKDQPDGWVVGEGPRSLPDESKAVGGPG